MPLLPPLYPPRTLTTQCRSAHQAQIISTHQIFRKKGKKKREKKILPPTCMRLVTNSSRLSSTSHTPTRSFWSNDYDHMPSNTMLVRRLLLLCPLFHHASPSRFFLLVVCVGGKEIMVMISSDKPRRENHDSLSLLIIESPFLQRQTAITIGGIVFPITEALFVDQEQSVEVGRHVRDKVSHSCVPLCRNVYY
ncbi:hypothetical protein BD289DRAFT_139485 [Coniella lustricola]|uniref:Uncharacterized protein n=1 Tax=Coniella lustricola TaxID=2025994 RepID=A0A2T3AF29_9PEZI|nr:hypothetical protein BD289DRAFT_139485 [Coniella lustricola]